MPTAACSRARPPPSSAAPPPSEPIRMTIHPEQLLAAKIPRIEQRYSSRDCILYALGIGVGLDPMDEADLPFVDETRLKVEPATANGRGYPGTWKRDAGFALHWG